jgi:hypothetical protein
MTHLPLELSPDIACPFQIGSAANSDAPPETRKQPRWCTAFRRPGFVTVTAADFGRISTAAGASRYTNRYFDSRLNRLEEFW